MNLYVLRMEDVGWDQYRGFVVAAEDEAEARRIAQDRAENYDQDFLNDGTCELIGVASGYATSGIILSDYKNA